MSSPERAEGTQILVRDVGRVERFLDEDAMQVVHALGPHIHPLDLLAHAMLLLIMSFQLLERVQENLPT